MGEPERYREVAAEEILISDLAPELITKKTIRLGFFEAKI